MAKRKRVGVLRGVETKDGLAGVEKEKAWGGLRRRKGNGKDGGSCGSMNKEGVGGTTEAGWMGEENRSIHPKPVGSFGSLV